MPADAAASSSPSVADFKRRIEELEAELRAERDDGSRREAAIGEVFQTLNSSLGNPAPVFNAIVEKALRLCGAVFGELRTYDGERFHLVASRGVPSAYAEYYRNQTGAYGPGTGPARILAGEEVVHVIDLIDTEAYRRGDPDRLALVKLGGARSNLVVPLRRGAAVIGFLMIYRQEAGPFSDKQIALLQNFAAQAVIAMENARLLSEQREALEQQTATTEVLQVINRSLGDLVPVFETILDKAHALCHVEHGALQLYDGKKFYAVASHGLPKAFANRLRQGYVPGPNLPVRHLFEGADFVQIPDLREIDDPTSRGAVEVVGLKTALFVALRKDGKLLGQIVAARKEVRPFSEKEISLLRNFAAQAVIAVENARLLSELRDSLERQTATGDVLRVISQSPTNVKPVLDAVVSAACRFCGAPDAIVVLREGDETVVAAHAGTLTATIGLRRPASATNLSGRAMLERRTLQIADIGAPEAAVYAEMMALARRHNWRASAAAPMLRGDKAIGCVVLRKPEPGLLSPAHVELLETFAAQAVIAIANAHLFSELRQRTDELVESLQQQTATADVLKVISRSTFDLNAVLHTLVESAAQLCEADKATITRLRNGVFYRDESYGFSPEFAKYVRELPIKPGRESATGRALLEGRKIHIADVEADSEFGLEEARKLDDFRTVLAVPMMRDGTAIGAMALTRSQVRPFSDKQIEMLSTFADQAVIAMENARLLSELRESLDQQTATAEVLRVINSSPGNVQPVFEVILAKAMTLCDAVFGTFATFDGERLHTVATHGVPEAFARFRRSNPPEYGPGTGPGRLVAGEDYVHDIDAADSDAYRRGDPNRRAIVDLGGARTILNVALRKDGVLLGGISIYRQEVRPFNDSQIGLLQGFASQAVIAMDNARLLGELTRREEELRVTFDNMGDGVVMFDADLQLASWNKNFQDLLDIPESFITGRPGLEDYVRLLAERGELGKGNVEQEIARYRERAGTQWSTERTRPDGRIIEVRNNPVPGGGAVLIYSDITKRKQAEAAIAAARDAAESALERQTATADILKVIASSPSDTQPAFDAIAQSANRLLGGLSTAVWRLEDDRYHLMAFTPTNSEADAALKAMSPLTRADGDEFGPLRSGRISEIPDSENAAPRIRDIARLRGFRSLLWVPLMIRETSIGFVSVTRREPGAFKADDVQLLKTFADQAVIAIQNARLFNDLRDSLERLKAAQANLVQSEKMASLGQLTAGIAHEIKNPLNFVNNFATLSVDLLDELREVAGPALETLDADRKAELDETMALLTGNLGKIAEHGKRADGIVKSMLSHSRGGSGDWAPSDINALVEEALNLAYHGARAQDKEFNITLERDLAKESKPIEVVPQDVTRVFLNLIGNGFYAANKRRTAAREAGFRPTLKVSTRDLGEYVEIRVRDNGIGIPPEMRDKLFQPFFTTKPTGEGTGLGLSISYDIVTQQHGGSIEVESEPGNFTEFTVQLPRRRRVSELARGL